MTDYGPEEAGVGGSTPSLTTLATLSIPSRTRGRSLGSTGDVENRHYRKRREQPAWSREWKILTRKD